MRILVLPVLVLIIGNLSSGIVSCPPVFSDNMVLQRDLPVAIWGTADPGEAVRVSFAGHAAAITANKAGTWRVFLPPLQVNSDPEDLLVSGQNILRYRNVLVGEVWLCSGQSNMEKPLGEQRGQKPTENHLEEIAAARHPEIRLFKMPRYGDSDQTIRWEICSPETIDKVRFSAVGYFFGVEVHEQLDFPIGLIDSSFGGTMIEAWIPEQAFLKDKDLLPLLDVSYFSWVEGVQATELFDSMMEPLCRFSLRGFLWYQGEANVMNGDSSAYTAKLRSLIDGWRTEWNLPMAPFYYVQLAPFNYSDWTSFPKRQTPLSLPAFWEAQAAVMNDPHVGMTVTTDLAGDARDIHPVKKREVGQRLARLALSETYGTHEWTARSPEVIREEQLGNGKFLLQYKHVGGGLKSRDGQPLTHFQIAGADGIFHPASASTLEPDKIVLYSEEVPNPVAARFAWEETANPNLVNSAGLPAIPFRTDAWPVQTIQSD